MKLLDKNMLLKPKAEAVQQWPYPDEQPEWKKYTYEYRRWGQNLSLGGGIASSHCMGAWMAHPLLSSLQYAEGTCKPILFPTLHGGRVPAWQCSRSSSVKSKEFANKCKVSIHVYCQINAHVVKIQTQSKMKDCNSFGKNVLEWS